MLKFSMKVENEGGFYKAYLKVAGGAAVLNVLGYQASAYGDAFKTLRGSQAAVCAQVAKEIDALISYGVVFSRRDLNFLKLARENNV